MKDLYTNKATILVGPLKRANAKAKRMSFGHRAIEIKSYSNLHQFIKYLRHDIDTIIVSDVSSVYNWRSWYHPIKHGFKLPSDKESHTPKLIFTTRVKPRSCSDIFLKHFEIEEVA